MWAQQKPKPGSKQKRPSGLLLVLFGILAGYAIGTATGPTWADGGMRTEYSSYSSSYSNNNNQDFSSPYVTCGRGWQEEYAALHKKILSGEAPQRFLVARGKGGFSNVLYGAITLFYMSLLTERAFVLDLQNHSDASYEWAFDQPNINWTFVPDRDIKGSAGYWDLFSLHSKQKSDEDEKFLDILETGDVRQIGAELDTIVAASNAGRTLSLISNPHHKKQFEKWGIRPETAFGCAMDYLFSLNNEVKTKFKEELTALNDESSLRIAVQVRQGDTMFFNKEREQPPDSWYDEVFGHVTQCAEVIERQAKAPGQKVIWYVISDDRYFREYTHKKYPNKVLTRYKDVTLMHAHFTAVEKAAQEQERIEAFQTVVGELWSLRKNDYFITMQGSGFARASAVMSGKWSNTFEVPVNATDWKFNPENACKITEAMNVYKLAVKAPGV